MEAHRYHVELEVLKASRLVELERIRAEGRTALAAAVAEVQEAALRQRLNEDIHLRAIAAEGRIGMEKAREAIGLFFSSVGRGASALLSDQQQLVRVVLSVVSLFTARFTTLPKFEKNWDDTYDRLENFMLGYARACGAPILESPFSYPRLSFWYDLKYNYERAGGDADGGIF